MDGRAAEKTEQTAGADLGSVGTAMKEGLVGSLKGLGEIEAGIASLVRGTVTDSMKLASDTVTMGVGFTADLMKGAIKATEEVGTGLTLGAKSVTKGLITGAGDVGGDMVTVAHKTVGGVVKGAVEVGGDIAGVAVEAVKGTADAAKEIGASAEDMAEVMVSGAVDAAGTIGMTAVKAAREMLVGVVDGVRGVVAAAFPAKGPAASSAEPTPDETQPKTSERDARGRFK